MWIDTAIQQSFQAHKILGCGLVLLLWSCTKGSSRHFLSPSPRNKITCGWSAGELIHCQYKRTMGWEDDTGVYQHSPQAQELLYHRQQPSFIPVQTHPDHCKPKPKLEKELAPKVWFTHLSFLSPFWENSCLAHYQEEVIGNIPSSPYGGLLMKKREEPDLFLGLLS